MKRGTGNRTGTEPLRTAIRFIPVFKRTQPNRNFTGIDSNYGAVMEQLARWKHDP